MASSDPRIIGYNSVRRALGLLGFALPVALFFYGWAMSNNPQPSISDYYHTAMGDVLVGTLCAIGIFLIAYRGYPRGENWFGDNWVSTLAGFGAIGVALFPTSYKFGTICNGEPCYVSGFTFHSEFYHLISAGAFFVCLAIFCFVLFPKGSRNEISAFRKKAENVTYYTCGVILIGTILGLIYVAILGDPMRPVLGFRHPVFWLETIGIVAFSVSWLTKGKIIAGLKSLVVRSD